MKANINTFHKPLHRACGTDELREYLCCIYFKEGKAWVTNANILIRQDLASFYNMEQEIIAALEDKKIKGKEFKALQGAQILSISDDRMTAVKKGVKIIVDLETGCEFVEKMKNVIPEKRPVNNDILSFHPDFFAIAAEIITENCGINLTMSEKKPGIILSNHENDPKKNIAVIMPLDKFNIDQLKEIEL